MNWFDSTLNIACLLNFFAILAAVCFNYKQYKQMNNQLNIQNEQLKQQNEQIRHSSFSTYTQRYREIILNFPQNINDNDFSYETLNDQEKETIFRYMRAYFDLCSEEYLLYKYEKIDEYVWKEWNEGMKLAFNKKAFRFAWKSIIKNTYYYKDFVDFVQSQIAQNDENSSQQTSTEMVYTRD